MSEKNTRHDSKSSRTHVRGGNPSDDSSPAPTTPFPAPERNDQPVRSAPPLTGFSGGGGVLDRRSGLDRRDVKKALGQDESDTGLERRRGPGRRRTDFAKAAEEGEMTPEQFLFVMAIDAFKKANGKMFPTWTDVLEVIRLLGYRKTMPAEIR